MVCRDLNIKFPGSRTYSEVIAVIGPRRCLDGNNEDSPVIKRAWSKSILDPSLWSRLIPFCYICSCGKRASKEAHSPLARPTGLIQLVYIKTSVYVR